MHPHLTQSGWVIVRRLANMCVQRVLAGDKLYIHCWGGHGRTGTLVALMLSRLYNLSADQALKYTQVLHDCRRDHQRVASPTTPAQFQQVCSSLTCM
jgi:protein tyrosine phosphatase